MKPKYFLCALLIASYLFIFSIKEQDFEQTDPSLTPPLPVVVQKLALGFFRELGAEMLFVKSAVFIGNELSEAVLKDNADILSLNLGSAISLYPEFNDPYYLCQATLPHISPRYASIANDMLEFYSKGDQPDIIIPFFRGFNYFYYMDEPQLAADVFATLALRADSPSWFGHFASILAARGGDLYAGLISLQSMLSVETDEHVRERYRRDIMIFNKAIMVQKATEKFYEEHGFYPKELARLVPQFIDQLPMLGFGYSLEWNPPELHLLKPLKKTN